MCGHGTIGTVTIMIEEGLVTPQTPGILRLETPRGLVLIEYQQEGKRQWQTHQCTRLSSCQSIKVECPDLGKLTVDVAYGGNYHAIIDPQDNYRDMADYTASQLIGWSKILEIE